MAWSTQQVRVTGPVDPKKGRNDNLNGQMKDNPIRYNISKMQPDPTVQLGDMYVLLHHGRFGKHANIVSITTRK